MSGKFESPGWHKPIAEVIRQSDGKRIANGLIEAIGAVVNHEGTCLIAFHRDRGPEVLHHTLEPAGRKHYLERYLAGPYLLDPLYELAISAKKPSIVRFREAVPDRFRASEYYRQYCERTHLLDEIDYLYQVSTNTTVVLVVGRRSRMFTKAELHRLELIEPVVLASMQKIWDSQLANSGRRSGKDDVHKRLTRAFERFGESVLTSREREVSQLLLRGHSSKSIARELRIAPGTVMVHKRNMFAKLGISSQYELFSLFIDDLGRL